MVTNPYDVLHYPSRPVRVSRIDRLELLARLFGLDPPPAATARVLEIGCGTGGNLLPMAEVFPQSKLVGIDLSESQMAFGNELRREAGLENVELRALDLTRIDDSFGELDYIIAHGVYSWVPAPVRARLVDVIGERLAPNGVAYLSYNTKPGFYFRAAARDLMLYHTEGQTDPRAQVREARRIMGFLASAVREDDSAWKSVTHQQAEVVHKLVDGLVRFDHLSEVNDAFYFRDVVADFAARGLAYLSEASLSSMMPHGIPPEAVRALDQIGEKDVVRREQYLDFIKNRQFRASLFVRGNAPISRKVELKRILDCHMVSHARPAGGSPDLEGPDPVVFEVSNARAHVGHVATRRALVDLARRYPASRRFDELLAEAGPGAGQLALELFHLYTCELVDFWPHADPFTVEPPARPRASPLARALAAREPKVANLRHETVELDAAERELLPVLDGTRDLAALQAAFPARDVPALLAAIGKKALFS